jgi:glutamyl-tRNA synthetase
LLAWLSARSQGGQIIFRMEDIDSPRVKTWAVQQAIDDLKWLGLDWDEGPDIGGPNAPYVQTERADRYANALEELKRAEAIYPCTCTRSDVEAAASAPHGGQEAPIYPGTCRDRRASDAEGMEQPYCWRFRWTDSASAVFDDLFRGHQECRPRADLGDFVISKANGTPAYQLAVVVDDQAMGVTEVVRGEDLVPSTFRQLAVFQFFGWKPPRYAHAPLVVGPDGRRLAKRHGDTRISILREQGVPAERLVGFLAHSCGLIDRFEPVAARDLIPIFDWKRLPPGPLVFTNEDWTMIVGSRRV